MEVEKRLTENKNRQNKNKIKGTNKAKKANKQI